MFLVWVGLVVVLGRGVVLGSLCLLLGVFGLCAITCGGCRFMYRDLSCDALVTVTLTEYCVDHIAPSV